MSHKALLKVKADDLQRRIPEAQKCTMAQVREKGGSSTLTTIPVAEHGFFFDVKADFHDHIHLHYCWVLDNCPPFVRVENDLQWTMPRSASCPALSTCAIMIQPISCMHHA